MPNAENSSPVTKGGLNAQAHIVAVVCLIVGAALGYFARGGSSPAPTQIAASQPQASTPTGMGGMGGGMGQQQPTQDQLRHMAEKQAQPLLDQLKANPNDAALLAKIGNVFYDTRNFKDAIDYYDRSLKIDPKNANVRTDLGTSYAYVGEADRAITEFQTAIKYDPKHGQSLYNEGMVQWQAKGNVEAAIASWEKLLKTVPEYPDRARVEQLVARAKQHTNMKPGTKTDKPAVM